MAISSSPPQPPYLGRIRKSSCEFLRGRAGLQPRRKATTRKGSLAPEARSASSSPGSPRSATPAAPDIFDTTGLPPPARTNKISRRGRIQSAAHARNPRTTPREPTPVAFHLASPRDEHSITRGAVASSGDRATVVAWHLCAVFYCGHRVG